MVRTPTGKVWLIVSQRNVAPAALGTMLPKASSTSDRVNSITNLKLDFTMHLLIKGSLKGNPRQNISYQRRRPKTDSPPIQTCSSQKRFTFQLQVQVKQAMVMAAYTKYACENRLSFQVISFLAPLWRRELVRFRSAERPRDCRRRAG